MNCTAMVDSRKLISQDIVVQRPYQRTPEVNLWSLLYVIMSMVANHAPFLPILTQFPSGSGGVNLACQLSNTTLKSSYIPPIGADLALKTSEEVVLLRKAPPRS